MTRGPSTSTARTAGTDATSAERDISEAFAGVEVDVASLMAMTNIFRVAALARNDFESSVLACHQLSWSAFVVLFRLRVWGEQETRHLAADVGVTSGTLTGVLKTLEKKGLAARRSHDTDRRRVIVSITPTGSAAVDQTMPSFDGSSVVSRALSPAEADELIGYLRRILTVAEADAGTT